VQAAREGDAERFTDDPATRLFLPLARKITRHAHKVTDEDVDALRAAGWDDEEILEAVHVAASFNLIDRLADTFGLGFEDLVDDAQRMEAAHAAAGEAPP
jgi:alkylhydroperoxidase family enzyme